MSRHAYLILAHSGYQQLNILLRMLDYPGNVLFLHVDAKSDFDSSDITVQLESAKLHMVPRIAVHWGGPDMVQAELNLLSEAVASGPFDYYHLLTGQDLPIQTQKTIQSFFTKNAGKEFISIGKPTSEAYDRLRVYHPLIGRRGRNRPVWENVKSYVDTVLTRIQKSVNVNRLPAGYEVRKGSQHFSITQDLAEHLVSDREMIMRQCRWTFCADEVFLQSYVWNSPWKERIYMLKQVLDDPTLSIPSTMRLIDWKRGKPYVWTLADLPQIEASDMLFARKFDMARDPELVQTIAELYGNNKGR